jgi:hypothetical protein
MMDSDNTDIFTICIDEYQKRLYEAKKNAKDMEVIATKYNCMDLPSEISIDPCPECGESETCVYNENLHMYQCSFCGLKENCVTCYECRESGLEQDYIDYNDHGDYMCEPCYDRLFKFRD